MIRIGGRAKVVKNAVAAAILNGSLALSTLNERLISVPNTCSLSAKFSFFSIFSTKFQRYKSLTGARNVLKIVNFELTYTPNYELP
jgi:hypothetical protein